MSKAFLLRKFAAAALFGTVVTVAAPAVAQSSPFKAGVDADSNGAIDVEEFVMALGEREMDRRDTNKDGRLSSEEWLGDNKGDFQKLTLDRFNTDSDGFMSAAEIVEVYTWVFGNRDKNNDGKLSVDETPKFLLNS